MTTDGGGLLQSGGRPKSCSRTCPRAIRGQPQTQPARRPGGQHATASATRLPWAPGSNLGWHLSPHLDHAIRQPWNCLGWRACCLGHEKRGSGERTVEAQLPGELLARIQPCCSGWAEGRSEGGQGISGMGGPARLAAADPKQ